MHVTETTSVLLPASDKPGNGCSSTLSPINAALVGGSLIIVDRTARSGTLRTDRNTLAAISSRPYRIHLAEMNAIEPANGCEERDAWRWKLAADWPADVTRIAQPRPHVPWQT